VRSASEIPVVARHQLEDVGPPGHHALAMTERVVVGRAARQDGQERRLAEREVGRVLAEVQLGRLLDAPRAVPVVDAVQVLLEDLLLGQHPLEPPGEHHLA